jgi:hypothetical protein
MLQKLFFAFLFCTCFTTSFGQAKQSNDADAILKVMNEQVAAWNAGDINRYMQTYWQNDSLIFIGKNGPTYGWNKTKENYIKGYPNKDAMGTLRFELIRIQKLSKKFYNVVGKWFLERPKAGNIGGAFTLVFQYINGNWVIVQDHSS